MKKWLFAILICGFISPLWADEKYPIVKPSGYLQLQGFYTDHGKKSDFGFLLKRIRVGFSGEINAKIAFGIELNATTDVVLDEAKIELSYLKNHTIMLGQFNVPFGVENPYSSKKILTINRAAFWDIFDEYDTGLAVSGDHGTIQYELATFIRPKANPQADHPEQDYVARLQLTTAAGLVLGGSTYYDRSNDDSASLDFTKKRFGGDIRLERSPVTVWFEILSGTDEAKSFDNDVTTTTDYLGYYGMAAYTLKPAWQVVAKYDVYDPDTSQDYDAFKRFTAGLNWRTEENIRLSANIEYREPEYTADPEIMGILQFQLVY